MASESAQPETIESFVQFAFNKNIKYIETLSSYEDINILCESTESAVLSRQPSYMLKLFCSQKYTFGIDFKKILEFKIRCVQHLLGKGFRCSEFFSGLKTQCVQDITYKSGWYGKYTLY